MNRMLGFVLGWKSFLCAFQAGPNRVLLSSSLSMALGLVPLIWVFSLADGMISGLVSRTIETATYHFQLTSPTSKDNHFSQERYHKMKDDLSRLSGFESIWPERDGFGLAYSSKGKRMGVKLRGIDPSWLNHDQAARSFLQVIEGDPLFPSEGAVWVGKEIASNLGLHVGDQIKVLTTRTKSERMMVPRITSFRISAIITIGYQDLDKLWLFLPIKMAERLLDLDEFPLYWGVKSSLPFKNIEEQKHKLTQAFSLHVQSWQDLIRSQFLNYQATRTLLLIIMVLIFLVSIVNITTAMMTTVLERQEDIAILKSMGFSPQTIHLAFLFLGFLTGMLGTLVALPLGILLVLGTNFFIQMADALVNFGLFITALLWKIEVPEFHLLNTDYYLEHIPIQLDPVFLCLVAVFSLLLSILASQVPSRRATRLRPLDILRKV